jgi:hypothetical protein
MRTEFTILTSNTVPLNNAYYVLNLFHFLLCHFIYLFPFVVITLYINYGKKSIGKMHKDFRAKNVETVHFAEFCPETCRRRAAQTEK